MISVDAILFDLDGTLIDSKRDLTHSVRHLQKQYGMRVSSEPQVGTFIGDGVVKLIQRAMPSLPKSKLDQAVAEFKQFYREHCVDHTTMYPGVLTTLKHFRHKKLAVVTNKPVRISARILDRLRLSSFFDVLIGGDSLPQKKPHPEPILNALKTMGLHRKRAVMVGDSFHDIRSGRAAGIHTCGVRSNIGDYQKLLKSRPDFAIGDITDLMRIFA